eukprot:TRINITY_DN25377_c0_g2_i1.p1 TRINITY_DN25377_c0_g2~~TRINITY_DN25377_c0_g2_i1.p1  ORF type:complete len:522 (-),score=42.61 TRINITY_DN25377_c0_g2_i1:529-2094(-)
MEDLFEAARKGRLDAVEEAVASGIDVNASCVHHCFGGLYYRQRSGRCEDEWEATFNGATALHVATYFRQPAVVSVLLRKGAAIDCKAREIRFHQKGSFDASKWRYKDVSALHLAVSGEECPKDEMYLTFRPGQLGLKVSSHFVVSVHRGGQAERAGVRVGWTVLSVDGQPYSEALLLFKQNGNCSYPLGFKSDAAADVLHPLLKHIRVRMLGHIPHGCAWNSERVSAIVNAPCGQLEWWFRGRKHTVMKGFTPLHLAMCFSERLKTYHSVEDVQALIGLVHADRYNVRYKSFYCADSWSGVGGLTALEMKMMMIQAPDPFLGALAWDLKVFEGCRDEWHSTIVRALHSHGICGSLVAVVLAFTQPSVLELAQKVKKASDDVRRRLRSFYTAHNQMQDRLEHSRSACQLPIYDVKGTNRSGVQEHCRCNQAAHTRYAHVKGKGKGKYTGQTKGRGKGKSSGWHVRFLNDEYTAQCDTQLGDMEESPASGSGSTSRSSAFSEESVGFGLQVCCRHGNHDDVGN